MEHQLWIHHRRGLWATPIDVLLGVLDLVGLPEGSHLVDSVSLSEHVLQVQILVDESLAHCGTSVSREKSESLQGLSLLCLVVVVGTVSLLAVLAQFTLVGFVVVWVVLFLLPAMAVFTPVLELATV